MGICEGLSRMSWKLSRTVLRGGVTGNGGSLLDPKGRERKNPALYPSARWRHNVPGRIVGEMEVSGGEGTGNLHHPDHGCE